MNKYEKIIKEYSTQKLNEIIETQSSSYSRTFIDYIKDELIRRGVRFDYNLEIQKEIMSLNDSDLRNLVENEWTNFHLEYLEIARKEYLNRKFINETDNDTIVKETKDKNPAMRTLSVVYSVFAIIYGILIVILIFSILAYNLPNTFLYIISVVLIGGLIVLSLLAVSESIIVLLNIEENTRKD